MAAGGEAGGKAFLGIFSRLFFFFNQLKKIMLSVCHQAPPAIGQGWPRDQELAAISPQSRV